LDGLPVRRLSVSHELLEGRKLSKDAMPKLYGILDFVETCRFPSTWDRHTQKEQQADFPEIRH
jgi:hypothetical protein